MKPEIELTCPFHISKAKSPIERMGTIKKICQYSLRRSPERMANRSVPNMLAIIKAKATYEKVLSLISVFDSFFYSPPESVM